MVDVDCVFAVESYLEGFRREVATVDLGNNTCRIIMPIFRPDGEAIEILISSTPSGRLRLSDDYLTSDYLFVNGLVLERNKRLHKKAQATAEMRGARIDDSEIFVETDPVQLGDAIESLLSAISAVSFLIYHRSHRQKRPFVDEVALYLVENEVDIDTTHRLRGETIYHSVPLFLNSNKNIAVSPLSTTSVSIAKREAKVFAFVVGDVKTTQPNVRFAAVLDDRKERRRFAWENDEVQTILQTHADVLVYWQEKESLLEYALT